MVPDTVRIIYSDVPFNQLMQLRKLSKSYNYGVILLVEERLKNLSRRDFEDIKGILNCSKRIALIPSIKNERLRISVAKVHISVSYVLWDHRPFIYSNDIQNKVAAFSDFLQCRAKYVHSLSLYDDKKELQAELFRLIQQRSKEIHQEMQFSSDSWVERYQLKTIPELCERLNLGGDNDRFYLALHHMFLDRTGYKYKEGVAILGTLADSNHTLSQWLIGEHYYKETSDIQRALNYMQLAANGNYFFACKLIKFLYELDAKMYWDTIKINVEFCINTNYPFGFYWAGILAKEEYFRTDLLPSVQARHYFDRGAALGCASCKRQLKKLDAEEAKPQSGCVIQ